MTVDVTQQILTCFLARRHRNRKNRKNVFKENAEVDTNQCSLLDGAINVSQVRA